MWGQHEMSSEQSKVCAGGDEEEDSREGEVDDG